MVIQYKCTNCGADMAFDSKSGKLHCDSCGNSENVDSMPKSHISYNTTEHKHKYFKENEGTEYKCNNCGATLITDGLTSATNCNFCGAGVVLSDRLSGSLAPSMIIPFKISKEEAKEAFKTWCKKGLLTPKGFMNADRITSITGLYVPFWLYDLDCDGEANATCTKVRTYEQGDYIVTETSYFDVYRRVKLAYDLVPQDASEKMNDELMEKLEPYHYHDLKEFNMPYLAGFIAEKYSYDEKSLLGKVRQRVSHYVESYIQSSILGYTTTTYTRKNINIIPRHAHYVLFPVWMVCYDYKKSEHTFAMNGQTGKIVGKPPLSFGKILLWFAGLSVSFFLIMQIITLLAGGAL